MIVPLMDHYESWFCFESETKFNISKQEKEYNTRKNKFGKGVSGAFQY